MKQFKILKDLPGINAGTIIYENGRLVSGEEISEKTEEYLRNFLIEFKCDKKWVQSLISIKEDTVFTTYFRKDKFEIYDEIKELGVIEEDLEEIKKYAMDEIKIEFKIKNGKCVGLKLVE